MIGRLTLEMKCKIAVWQEAYVLVRQIQRFFNEKFKINSALTRRTIYETYRKFLATGSILDTKQLGKPRSGCSEENIQELEEAYALSEGKSIRRATVTQDISRLSIQQMLLKDIKAFPNKLQTEHKLEKEENDRREEMCETLLNHYKNDPFILDKKKNASKDG